MFSPVRLVTGGKAVAHVGLESVNAQCEEKQFTNAASACS